MTGNPEIYEGLIFGVGKGTFIVALAGLVGIFMCCMKDCIACPTLCVVAGFAIPAITLACIRSLPVKSLDTDEVQQDKLPTSQFQKNANIFMWAIIILTASLLLEKVCAALQI